MAVYSFIQKSQLEGALRLDAEYYQPEYLEIISKIKSQKSKFLGDLVSNIINGDEIREYVNDDGLPYLRVSDIKEFFIDLSSVVYISKDSKIKQNIKLIEGDILLSRSGSLGIAAVVTPDLANSVISSHLMRIPVKSINPYFLVTFLNSKFGKSQIIQRNNGAVVPEINHPSLKTVLVPILPENQQREVELLVKKAYEQIQNSNLIYSQAENLLLEELGLKDFKVEEELSYVVDLSEVKSAHRADAEYFQPKYEKIFKFIKSPIKKLEEITKFLNHAKQPPYIDGGEISIITQKHLGNIFLNLEPINEPDTKFTSAEWLKRYPEYQLKFGDVLYYSVGAYIGKTNIVFENLQATAASFITIIRPSKEIDSVYLTVVLNSVIGQLQSEKWQSATAQQYIYPKDIKNFKIPILPKLTQQKIADLVQKSHEARSKAKQLLEEAKQKVEGLIEK